MALESLPLLMNKFAKKDNQTSQRMEKNKVRVSLEAMISEYLTNYEDVLTFEATPKALDAVLELVEDAEMNEKYIFMQVSETTFNVALKDLDLF